MKIFIKMHSFSHRESYKHKCAKDIFKEWCDSLSWDEGGDISDDHGNYRTVSTSYSRSGEGILFLHWRSNRVQKAWLEYPIVADSITANWDETFYSGDEFVESFVPTYNECISANYIPTAIIDVVLPHKGRPKYFIEICHKNPVSDEKVEKLKQLGVKNLIEIDADWILNQINIPSKINIKRWLI